MTLVIVESSTKAKVIEKYLNGDAELRKLYGKFTVVASQGHINDLGPKKLSIDPETYEPQYTVTADKKKRVAELRKHVKSNDVVFLASDADREGAGIAYQLQTVLRPKKSKRMTFTEITPSALKQSVMTASDEIDGALVDAQKARRVLDRLVGYKLSPLMWRVVSAPGSTPVSVGRVQSAVLNMVCERERHIREFRPVSSWSIEATFVNSANVTIDATMISKPTPTGGKIKLDSIDEARRILKDDFMDSRTSNTKYTVKSTTDKRITRSSPPPFVTSTLQQDAQSRLGYGLKKTMALAQGLYEKGMITYMRTDSTHVSKDATELIVDTIGTRYGTQYIAKTPKKTRKRVNAQEAHECIRPTDISLSSLPTDFETGHQRLYETIWKRTVASFMEDACYEERTTVLVPEQTRTYPHAFVSRRRTMTFDGFMRLYPDSTGTKDPDVKDPVIKEFVCTECTAVNESTSPSMRYTEASMVKEMESQGIGRPSTYASILSKLFERTYIDNAPTKDKDKRPELTHLTCDPIRSRITESHTQRAEAASTPNTAKGFRPTTVGERVNDLVSMYFSTISDAKYTARMESELDKIADGTASFFDVTKRFDDELESMIAEYKRNPPEKKQNAKTPGRIVDDKYEIKRTRFGPVIQYEGTDGKPVYTDLRAYMKVMDTSTVTGLASEDIAFLASLPLKLPNVTETDTVLHYGRYGFYVEQNGERKSIQVKTPPTILRDKMMSLTQKDIDGMAIVQRRWVPRKKNV
jgi:DNA topoisomerase-1